MGLSRCPTEWGRLSVHLVALSIFVWADRTQAQDFSILYHETLPALEVVETAGSADGSGPEASLSFVAFGRQFDLRLERNDGLARRLRASGRALDLEIYRGDLVGIPGSWVRLTRRGRSLSGAVWDGSALYGIDPADRIRPQLVDGRGNDPKAHVIFRVRDTVGVLFDTSTHAPTGSTPHIMAAATGSALESLTTPALKQLDIGFLGDVKFATASAFPQSDLISIANVLEGIFLAQLGLHINVAEVQVSGATDPFSTTLDAATLLGEVQDYKGRTPTLRSLDLVHLFTGRDLADGGSTGAQLVGIASVGAVCDEVEGAALTQATFGTLTAALIAAHEIGHNLGAPHDQEAGPCVSAPAGFIMSANLNGSETFSACSIEQMRQVIDSASCLLPPLPNDLALSTIFAPTSLVQSISSRINVLLETGSGTDVLLPEVRAQGSSGVTVSMSASVAGWTCASDACRGNRVSGGQAYGFDVNVVAEDLTQPAVVTVTATSGNDSNTVNNVVSVTLPVVAAVALSTSIDPANVIVRPGDPLVWHVTVKNDKNTATNVAAALWFTGPIAVDEIVGATCTLTGSIDRRCSLGAMPAGAPRDLEVRAHALPSDTGAGGVTVIVTADQSNASAPLSSSVSARASFLVTNAIADLVGTISAGTPVAGASVQYLVTYENRGPDLAKDLTFTINTLGAYFGMQVQRFGSNVGVCEVRPSATYRCGLNQLAAGEKFVFTLDGTAGSAGAYSLAARGTAQNAFDPSGGDTSTSFSIVSSAPAPEPAPAPTTPPIPTPAPTSTGSGGGGGSVDVAWLLLLASAACVRRSVSSASSRR